MKQPWEEAQIGQRIEQGFALATGTGSAEIELENGSTVYLAGNSLLLFSGLPSPGDRIVTHVSLATGTAAFWLETAAGESFFIETPTDGLHLTGPHTYRLRVDAYLDSTAITPLGRDKANLVRTGRSKLEIGRGQTVFFQAGAILTPPGSNPTLASNDSDSSDSARRQQWQANIERLRDSGVLQTSVIPRDFFGLESPEQPSSPSYPMKNAPFNLNADPLAGRSWDQWVEYREQTKQATMAAALKASGLSSPMPGLAELYSHGTFFACEPYGTCWEPKQSQSPQAADAKAAPENAQATLANSASQGFQPQTVQWQEMDWGNGPCDFSGGSRTISRTAHTPEELRELLRRKSMADSNGYLQSSAWDSCYRQRWVFHRGHYAMVLPRSQPPCSGTDCKPVHPVHPPHPVFVRVGNTVGFVPSHPDDVKGKPPVNLKNGIILPPARPGEAPQRIAWDPSQKLTFVNKPPKEFVERSAPYPLRVAAPEIRGRLAQEAWGRDSLHPTNHTNLQITYDYKSQRFMMPAAAGAKAGAVPVGGIASNGRVETFASGQSSRYAESFGRTSAAASYTSGGGNVGPHSFSSGSSGGSSSGSYSHSSGGGGGGSMSSSSSSSSSGSSGGSHPH